MAVPWRHHQRTSELGIIFVTMRPMGTSCPSRRGGRTTTSTATWTMSCTTATSTPLSTTTWSGRRGSRSPTSSLSPLECPQWEFTQGALGRDFPPFPPLCTSFVESHYSTLFLKVILFHRKTGGPTRWWGKCRPAAPAVSGVTVSWSFDLNCQQMCRLWISNKHLHSKPCNIQTLGNPSRQNISPQGLFVRKAAASPTEGT